jgi:hypothetical protein
VSLFIASILSSFLISLIYEFSYNDIVHPGTNQVDFMPLFYGRPWTRIAPYLIGIFFAELFLSIPKNNEESTQVKTQMTKINTIIIIFKYIGNK